MKKSTKIILIIAGVLVAVGIVLTVIGVALGGSSQYEDYIKKNGNVSVVLFPHSLKLHLSAGNDGVNVNVENEAADWDEDDWDTLENKDQPDRDGSDTDDQTEKASQNTDDTDQTAGRKEIATAKDEIEKLDLSLGAGVFTMKPSEDDNFYAAVKGKDKLRIKKENGTLRIQTKAHNVQLVGVRDTQDGVTLYLPERAYKKLSLSLGAGTMTSDVTLQAEKIELEVGMGTLEAAVDASEKLSVDVGMGEADLTLNGSESDYDADIDVGAGSVLYGSRDLSGLSREYTSDNGADKKVKIDCGMGTVNVAFRR